MILKTFRKVNTPFRASSAKESIRPSLTDYALNFRGTLAP